MSVWIAETLIATTLLLALVMLLRRPVARWLGAGAAYMLWLLPLLRMAMPALPTEVATPSPLHVAVDQSGLTDLLVPTPSGGVESASAFPWLETAIALWFVGLVAFMVLQAVGYARFRRHILSGSTEFGREGRIALITSPQASGPLAFGIFHPYIVLPVDFALRYDAQEQDMAIAHERAHHARGDLIANMIALALLGIHWCNPIAWIAYRAYRADQETACDARVLSLYGRDQAHAYGRAILKAAGGRQFAAACHLNRIATLKGRLKMLSNHDVSLSRISWGMAAVAIVTATGLALTASGSRAAQQMAAITDQVGSADFTRLKELVAQPAIASVEAVPAVAATPAVPAVPAVPAKDMGSVKALAPVDPVAVPAPPAPMAPAAPIPPAADMSVPMPPMPPAPPVVRSEKGRITVTHADGRVETHRIPTEADIARMVPVVDVRDGCDGSGRTTSRSETVDANGRRHIKVRICNSAIERAADRAEAQAERAAARADRDMARAERAQQSAHVAALSGLRAARARIANNASMPDYARAEALRGIDRSIAQWEKAQD